MAQEGSSSISEKYTTGGFYYQITANIQPNWYSENGYLLYQYDPN
ncbi:MAG: hypothetical protein ACP5T6_02245 [Candidatus Micrarchaeia archaeon]